MSSSTQQSPVLPSTETARDIFLWRRKKLSVLVLVVSTAIWALLDVYRFNLVTVASWVAMFAVSSLFAYGQLVRLFRKEEPNWSGFEMSEVTAIEAARKFHRSMEAGIRWMFHVSAEREWFIFARVLILLWVLSYMGSVFDFPTMLYAGIIGGLTIPVIYKKNEDKIERGKHWIKMKARHLYEMVDDKLFQKVKSKIFKEEKKDKKVE